MTKELDLAQVFKAVSKTLVENQSSLDEADTVNHDHGTNMVNTFKLIEKAVKAKKRWYNHRTTGICQPNAARKKSTSGSAMLYADGLENAAKEFEGKTFDREGVGTLLNALMGTPKPGTGTNTICTTRKRFPFHTGWRNGQLTTNFPGRTRADFRPGSRFD